MTRPRSSPMAHRPADLTRRPRVSADDWRALAWLIVVVCIVIALCAVEPSAIRA